MFLRRLKFGMRLQTDPTVIYGIGAAYDGNIRRRDLETDTPYNTYTRDGLPPTPIALPGRPALEAATRPAAGDALYFVARGDGSHEFSPTLDEHNRAGAEVPAAAQPMSGRLITLEGGEGAGKSTVLAALRARLAAHGIEVVVTREPGGTPFGEAVRALVLDPRVATCAPKANCC